ncbi:MAG: vanadium-dependent haloperoxidase [bacterium]|nr:vanadium-dependent haloperoxidase [bacterium]
MRPFSRSWLSLVTCTLLVTAVLSFTVPSAPVRAQVVSWQAAAQLDPAFLQEWVQVVYDAAMREATNPPNSARIYGYAGVTLYEALFPGMPLNRSLVGQLNGLRDLPYPDETQQYDWTVVTAAAMQTVMDKLFVNAAPETYESFVALREAHIAASLETFDAEIVEGSAAFGDELGAAILEWVSDDNYDEIRRDSAAYEIPTGDPSLWVLTNPNARPAEPLWGQVRPFALDYADECLVPLNYEFSTDENSAFYQQAVEIMDFNNNSTPEMRETAEWWVDTPGLTGAPAGHWMLIGSQLVDQLDLDTERAAEMYAMLGISVADAFISCWSAKYQFNLLRPETYIQEYISRRWEPYIETPPFPEYPSGHSVVSAAAGDALTNLFGQVVFTDSANTFRGLRERTYYSFEQAATEAAISRLYGGIHFRTAVENGMRQGRCVTERIFDRIVLDPVAQGE